MSVAGDYGGIFMQNTAEKLVLLSGLLADDVVAALAAGDSVGATRALLNKLPAGQAGKRPLARYLLGLLLQDEGYFARQCAANQATAALMEAQAEELAVLAAWQTACDVPQWLVGQADELPEGWPPLLDWCEMPPLQVAAALAEFHRQNGTGLLALHRVWRWCGKLAPVEAYDRVRLSHLVGCQSQKDEVMANTRLFLESGRGNNMLLYGARGTGKSSLIKAVANELADSGLCLVELPLNRIADLPTLQEILHKQPRRYIIFIDDLSFEKAGEDYKITKAVLEGSVSGRGGNVLIYATSNRRHLVVENWQDREQVQYAGGEVHAGDSMSEKLSLADRFGQTVLFTTPDQQEYLRIVRHLAAEEGITLEPAELERRALQWALWQNGKSGRTARQFIDSIDSGKEGA